VDKTNCTTDRKTDKATNMALKIAVWQQNKAGDLWRSRECEHVNGEHRN